METTDTNSTKEMNKDAIDRKTSKRNRTPFSEMRISFMKNMGKDVSREYEPDKPQQEDPEKNNKNTHYADRPNFFDPPENLPQADEQTIIKEDSEFKNMDDFQYNQKIYELTKTIDNLRRIDVTTLPVEKRKEIETQWKTAYAERERLRKRKYK